MGWKDKLKDGKDVFGVRRKHKGKKCPTCGAEVEDKYSDTDSAPAAA
tara:strand:- start:811 stop:951 length:141 start_codon:yes stop_codon:yes gene_type:complete